jgi:hypothetical protein
MAVNYIVSLGCMGVNVGYYLFAYSLIRLQASSNLFILGWWLYVFAGVLSIYREGFTGYLKENRSGWGQPSYKTMFTVLVI